MSIFVTVLPEDAILEILLRLPVKSLHRFKCVAKSWYACITDPQFINRHFLSSNNQEFLLISHLHPVKNHLLSLTIENNPKHFRLSYPNSSIGANPSFAQILGPCNGIFCLFDSSKNGVISLWNPANRQLKTLPKSQIEPPSDAYPFDTCVGFGFDGENNDFKVVSYKHMCLLSSSTMAHAELYSLRTNTWKEVEVGEEFQPTGNLPHSSLTPSVNGMFSWFEIDNRAQKMIFSFNMKTEVFVKTQLPDYGGIPSKRVHGCLASLQGKLAFIHDYPLIGGSSKCFDVWVLGEYGVRDSWVKQLTIGPLLGVRAPLGFWKNGELLLEDAERKRVVSYDPISQDMKCVGACKMDDILQVLPYKESLVCFKEEKEEETDQNREMVTFSVSECQENDILDN